MAAACIHLPDSDPVLRTHRRENDVTSVAAGRGHERGGLVRKNVVLCGAIALTKIELETLRTRRRANNEPIGSPIQAGGFRFSGTDLDCLGCCSRRGHNPNVVGAFRGHSDERAAVARGANRICLAVDVVGDAAKLSRGITDKADLRAPVRLGTVDRCEKA